VNTDVVGSGLPQFLGNSRNLGKPIVKNCKRMTPLRLYKTYYSDSLMSIFVESTNSFARNSNIPRWTDVTINEMHRFHAILMIFSIACSSDRRLAWDDPLFKMPVVF
jgi:hypothetical protein